MRGERTNGSIERCRGLLFRSSPVSGYIYPCKATTSVRQRVVINTNHRVILCDSPGLRGKSTPSGARILGLRRFGLAHGGLPIRVIPKPRRGAYHARYLVRQSAFCQGDDHRQTNLSSSCSLMQLSLRKAAARRNLSWYRHLAFVNPCNCCTSDVSKHDHKR